MIAYLPVVVSATVPSYEKRVLVETFDETDEFKRVRLDINVLEHFLHGDYLEVWPLQVSHDNTLARVALPGGKEVVVKYESITHRRP